MKSHLLLRIISLWLILLLTTAAYLPLKSNPALSRIQKSQNKEIYFNPRQYFNKQCAFCHRKDSKIAPSMSEVKATYLSVYPKKEDFVEKMTNFVLNPKAELRLIKNNLKKYKVMPNGMFHDATKIQQVAAYIYETIELPKQFKPQKNNLADQKFRKGTNIGNILKLKPIKFELGKTKINSIIAKRLDKLVQFLKSNPKINIEIRSYTDSRGSKQKNLQISSRRANAIRRYLISHGIPYKRITAKGYGESKLLNRCKDGVRCTEAEHAKNRRTEILIK